MWNVWTGQEENSSLPVTAAATIQTATYTTLHGANPLFARPALEQFNLDNTIRFFRELGVYPRYESEGKVFPYSGNASAVLDALRLELERLSVPIITNKGISSIEQTKEGFDIIDTENNRFSTRKVLVAAGRHLLH